MSHTFTRARIEDKQLNLSNFNRMMDVLERVANMRFTPDFYVVDSPAGIQVGMRKVSSGLTLDSTVCFGYILNPDGDNTAEVKIYSGELHHGTRAIIDIPDTKVVITADHQYVWLEYVYASGNASIAGPSTSRPVSSDADSTYRKWLYMFRLISGVASLERNGLWNVELPGSFA